MSIIARQSTARTIMVGPVLDADGVAVTGGVVGDFKISKNGAAPGALDGSATLTHRHTGFYSLALTANDLDTVGSAQVTIDDTTNACPMANITVVEEAIYDALYAASANGFAGAAGSSTVAVTNLTVAASTTLAAGTHNPQSGDAYAYLGTNLGAAGANATEAGGTGDHLTAMPWNAAWDAEVQSEVEDGLVVYRLDELLAADSDIDGLAPPTVGSVFHELMSKTAGSFTFDQTTDSLEAASDKIGTPTDLDGGGATIAGNATDIINYVDTTGQAILAAIPSAAANADAVWDEDATGHQTQGTFGQAIGDPGADSSTIWGLANTNLDAAVSSRSSHSAADVWGVDPSGYVSSGTFGYNVATIYGLSVGVSGFAAISTGLTLLYIDTQAIVVDTQDIQSRIPAALVGGRMDATVDGTGMETGAIDAIWTRALTEAYAADGATFTGAQALYMIYALLAEASASGTTLTIKKLDGSTTAMTFTLNDASTPTSITRSG